jgi:hypothetical protein
MPVERPGPCPDPLNCPELAFLGGMRPSQVI